MQRLTKKQRDALKLEIKERGYLPDTVRVTKAGMVTAVRRRAKGFHEFVGYDYNLVKGC